MSKKSSVPSLAVPSNSPMGGRIVYDYEIQSLEGRLLTFIESLGLRESQEKSAKDIFREIFYDGLYQRTLYVRGELLQPVTEVAWKEKHGDAGVITGAIAR